MKECTVWLLHVRIFCFFFEEMSMGTRLKSKCLAAQRIPLIDIWTHKKYKKIRCRSHNEKSGPYRDCCSAWAQATLTWNNITSAESCEMYSDHDTAIWNLIFITIHGCWGSVAHQNCMTKSCMPVLNISGVTHLFLLQAEWDHRKARWNGMQFKCIEESLISGRSWPTKQ